MAEGLPARRRQDGHRTAAKPEGVPCERCGLVHGRRDCTKADGIPAVCQHNSVSKSALIGFGMHRQRASSAASKPLAGAVLGTTSLCATLLQRCASFLCVALHNRPLHVRWATCSAPWAPASCSTHAPLSKCSLQFCISLTTKLLRSQWVRGSMHAASFSPWPVCCMVLQPLRMLVQHRHNDTTMGCTCSHTMEGLLFPDA